MCSVSALATSQCRCARAACAICRRGLCVHQHRLTGTPQNLPRWKRCVQSTEKALGFALAHAFVKRVFPPESKTAAVALVQEIESGFGQDVDGLGWMDAVTKQRAKDKLAALANQIGYPEVWRNYATLELSRTGHLGNVLAGRSLRGRLPALEGRQAGRSQRVGDDPADGERVLQRLAKPDGLPRGILQPPFFGRDQAAR